jgi:branched-chain amino acid transport system permease protein
LSGLLVLGTQIINGLTLGTAYGLVAVGYTLVYSILRLVNFAHGEVYMAGCYAALFTVNALLAVNAPPFAVLVLSLIAGMAMAGLLGLLIERLAYRRVRRISIPATMITSLGMSILLQNVAFVLFGATPTNFPNLFPRGAVLLLGIPVLFIQVFLIAVTLAALVGLMLWIHRTNTGIAMRCVAQDPVAAGLVGIDSNRIVTLAFVIGSALAGMAGWLFGMYYGRAVFYMGLLPGLKAFTACIIGGMGSIPGALLGTIIMGELEVLSGAYISLDYKDVFALSALLLILILRPSGLLGGRDVSRRV